MFFCDGDFEFAIDNFEYTIGDKVVLVDATALVEYGSDYDGDTSWNFSYIHINYAEDNNGNIVNFTTANDKDVVEKIKAKYYEKDWSIISEIIDRGY